MPLFKIFTFDMPNLESKCEGLLQSCFSNGGAAHKKYGKLPFLTTFSKILGTATFFNRFKRNSKLKLLRSKELKFLSFVKISQKLWELQQMKVCNTLTAHPVLKANFLVCLVFYSTDFTLILSQKFYSC